MANSLCAGWPPSAQAATASRTSIAKQRIANSCSGPAGLDLALIIQKVELGRRLAQAGQDHMCVTAMMGLVVEPVGERRRQLLHELLGARDPAVADDAGQPRLLETADVGDDALVLGLARGAQLGQALVHDRVQAVGRFALAGKALHPDAVGG